MKGIDPKWTMYLGLLVAIEQAIGHGTVSLTNLIPADWAPYITSWCNFLAFIGTSIMTWQAAVSSPKAGPAIDTPIAPAAKAAVLLAVLLGSLFVLTGDARAQAKLPLQLKPLTGNIGNDLGITGTGSAQALTGNVGKDLQSLLSKPLQDLQAFIAGDFMGAAELAVKIPDLQDGNGQACWTMLQSAGAVLKEHPVPITFKGATDLEALRLLLMTANKVCSNAACTQVFTEAGNIITSLAPLSVPIPNLTSLCSKVPGIAVVAPTAPAAASSAVPATPPGK